MGAVVRWGTIILGVISIVLLLQLGFQLGFVAPLEFGLNWFDRFLRLLMHGLEPYIVLYAREIFGLRVQLSPVWRYVTLIWVLFSPYLTTAYVYGDEAPAVKVFWYAVGVAVTIFGWGYSIYYTSNQYSSAAFLRGFFLSLLVAVLVAAFRKNFYPLRYFVSCISGAAAFVALNAGLKLANL